MHVRLVRVRCRGSGLPCRQLSFTERPRSSTGKKARRAARDCLRSLTLRRRALQHGPGSGPVCGPRPAPYVALCMPALGPPPMSSCRRFLRRGHAQKHRGAIIRQDEAKPTICVEEPHPTSWHFGLHARREPPPSGDRSLRKAPPRRAGLESRSCLHAHANSKSRLL